MPGPHALVGSVASPHCAFVDSVGSVWAGDLRPWIEWWIGAEDAWHVPSTSTTIRQRFVGNTPVVETSMHVPGGDIIHRVFGVPGLAVIEVENQSAVPVAVAFAIRPYHGDRWAEFAQHEVSVVPEGAGARVDTYGGVALRFEKAPSQVALSNDVDVLHEVRAGNTVPFAGRPHTVGTRTGQPHGAVVFPLSHTAVVRAVAPLRFVPIAEIVPPSRRWRRPTSAASPAPDGGGESPAETGSERLPWPAEVPAAEQVVKGWATHADRGTRIVLPAGRLADRLAQQTCGLLVAAGDGSGAPARLADPSGGPEACAVAPLVAGLSAMGFEPEADALVAALFAGPLDARALCAGAHQLWLRGEVAAIERHMETMAKRAHKLAKRARRGDPASIDPWLAPALRAVAAALHAAGQPAAATLLSERLAGLPARPDPTSPLYTDVDSSPDGPEVVVNVRNLLVHEQWEPGDEQPGSTLVLLHDVPAIWLGQGIEVHDLPTGFGRISFGVRWHGERPALLWDLVPRNTLEVRLVAPGLDQAWSTTEPRGEALLAMPEHADVVRTDVTVAGGGATGTVPPIDLTSGFS